MERNFENVDILCNRFEQCKRSVRKNKSVVEMFLQSLKSMNQPFEFNFVKNSEFIGIGSSYENTAVNSKADFDIAMVLPSPFDMDHLECLMAEEPGLYLLQCKNNTPLLRQFLNQSNILATEDLKRTVFYELSFALENMEFEDYTVEFETLSSSFCVKLKKRHQYFIKIDIVPQIKAKVNDIPDWKSENLPLVIQNYIASEDTHILFNLSCPPNKKIDLRSCIVQPSLNLLEKVGMLHSGTVRKSVCIAKSVYKHCKWSGKGLRSFHIKRIALHLYNKIDGFEYPWIGYSLIMNELLNMLKNGKIDGCFIANQNLICIDTRKCLALAKEVKEIERTVDEDNILDFLETPVIFECIKSFPVIPVPSPEQARPMKPVPSSEQSRSIIPVRSSEQSRPMISVPSPEQSHKLNVPPFMENSVSEWFDTLEAQLLSFRIYSEEAKFLYAHSALPHEVSKQIPQSVIDERRFNYLKNIVIEFYAVKKWESFESKSPSIFASECQAKNVKESQRMKDNSEIGVTPVKFESTKGFPVISIPSSRQSLKFNVPPFMENSASEWFNTLEAQFMSFGIYSDEAKFLHVYPVLPHEVSTQIPQFVISERRFDYLKKIVIYFYEKKLLKSSENNNPSTFASLSVIKCQHIEDNSQLGVIPPSRQSLIFNVPPFMEYSASEWFDTLEAQFLSFGIYSDEAKFLYAYSAIPHEVSKQIPQSVIDERRFIFLKKIVIGFYAHKKWESFESESPSIFATESQSKNVKESERIEDNSQIGSNSKAYNSFDPNMWPRRSLEFNTQKESTEQKPQQDFFSLIGSAIRNFWNSIIKMIFVCIFCLILNNFLLLIWK